MRRGPSDRIGHVKPASGLPVTGRTERIDFHCVREKVSRVLLPTRRDARERTPPRERERERDDKSIFFHTSRTKWRILLNARLLSRRNESINIQISDRFSPDGKQSLTYLFLPYAYRGSPSDKTDSPQLLHADNSSRKL